VRDYPRSLWHSARGSTLLGCGKEEEQEGSLQEPLLLAAEEEALQQTLGAAERGSLAAGT
jgi:hypothetical protein